MIDCLMSDDDLGWDGDDGDDGDDDGDDGLLGGGEVFEKDVAVAG